MFKKKSFYFAAYAFILCMKSLLQISFATIFEQDIALIFSKEIKMTPLRTIGHFNKSTLQLIHILTKFLEDRAEVVDFFQWSIL